MEKRSLTKKRVMGVLQSKENLLGKAWERSKGFPNKK